MPCYKPLTAWYTSSGDVVFVDTLKRNDIIKTLSLPCGQCIGCRLERSRQWAMRCMHEASLHSENSFVTLTYDDAHCPASGSLDYPEFQRFMKRLRRHFAPREVRFYMCGEYGPELGRPHFHACLFGVDFPDKVYFSKGPNDDRIYTSAILDRLWSCGFSTVGALSFESAAYVARYCVSKVTGDAAESHYGGRVPEFNHMSLKPGIGTGFFEKWHSDIYPHDYVVVNGKEVKPPKYYDRLYSRLEPDVFEDLKFLREQDGRSRWEDNTDERLAVKAVVAAAKSRLLIRSEVQ